MKENDGYFLPSGVVQIGETSEEAIIRTFQETTGFKVKPINVLSTYEDFRNRDGRNCHQLSIFYKLDLLDAAQQPTPDSDANEGNYAWVNLAELKTINLRPAGIADRILSNATDSTHFIDKRLKVY